MKTSRQKEVRNGSITHSAKKIPTNNNYVKKMSKTGVARLMDSKEDSPTEDRPTEDLPTTLALKMTNAFDLLVGPCMPGTTNFNIAAGATSSDFGPTDFWPDDDDDEVVALHQNFKKMHHSQYGGTQTAYNPQQIHRVSSSTQSKKKRLSATEANKIWDSIDHRQGQKQQQHRVYELKDDNDFIDDDDLSDATEKTSNTTSSLMDSSIHDDDDDLSTDKEKTSNFITALKEKFGVGGGGGGDVDNRNHSNHHEEQDVPFRTLSRASTIEDDSDDDHELTIDDDEFVVELEERYQQQHCDEEDEGPARFSPNRDKGCNVAMPGGPKTVKRVVSRNQVRQQRGIPDISSNINNKIRISITNTEPQNSHYSKGLPCYVPTSKQEAIVNDDELKTDDETFFHEIEEECGRTRQNNMVSKSQSELDGVLEQEAERMNKASPSVLTTRTSGSKVSHTGSCYDEEHVLKGETTGEEQVFSGGHAQVVDDTDDEEDSVTPLLVKDKDVFDDDFAGEKVNTERNTSTTTNIIQELEVEDCDSSDALLWTKYEVILQGVKSKQLSPQGSVTTRISSSTNTTTFNRHQQVDDENSRLGIDQWFDSGAFAQANSSDDDDDDDEDHADDDSEDDPFKLAFLVSKSSIEVQEKSSPIQEEGYQQLEDELDLYVQGRDESAIDFHQWQGSDYDNKQFQEDEYEYANDPTLDDDPQQVEESEILDKWLKNLNVSKTMKVESICKHVELGRTFEELENYNSEEFGEEKKMSDSVVSDDEDGKIGASLVKEGTETLEAKLDYEPLQEEEEEGGLLKSSIEVQEQLSPLMCVKKRELDQQDFPKVADLQAPSSSGEKAEYGYHPPEEHILEEGVDKEHLNSAPFEIQQEQIYDRSGDEDDFGHASDNETEEVEQHQPEERLQEKDEDERISVSASTEAYCPAESNLEALHSDQARISDTVLEEGDCPEESDEQAMNVRKNECENDEDRILESPENEISVLQQWLDKLHISKRMRIDNVREDIRKHMERSKTLEFAKFEEPDEEFVAIEREVSIKGHGDDEIDGQGQALSTKSISFCPRVLVKQVLRISDYSVAERNSSFYNVWDYLRIDREIKFTVGMDDESVVPVEDIEFSLRKTDSTALESISVISDCSRKIDFTESISVISEDDCLYRERQRKEHDNGNVIKRREIEVVQEEEACDVTSCRMSLGICIDCTKCSKHCTCAPAQPDSDSSTICSTICIDCTKCEKDCTCASSTREEEEPTPTSSQSSTVDSGNDLGQPHESEVPSARSQWLVSDEKVLDLLVTDTNSTQSNPKTDPHKCPAQKISATSAEISMETQEDASSDDECVRKNAAEQNEENEHEFVIAKSENQEDTEKALPTNSNSPLPFSYLHYTDPTKSESYFGFRLQQAVMAQESSLDQCRSSDVIPLTKQYQDFRRRLQTLVKSLKAYQKATRELESSRSKCFEDCANLFGKQDIRHHNQSKKGGFPAVSGSPQTKEVGCPIPIMAMHELARVQEKLTASEFEQWVLDYVTKWEKDVTSKIDTELQHVKKLQQSRLHYEKKVEGLRQKIIGLESKGKSTPSSLAEKVNRNEEKLHEAWKTHEQRAGQLCRLIEQVTEHGWKDLFPLVENLLKWEFNRSGRENVIYGQHL